MSFTPAKIITSSQEGPHQNLALTVSRHLESAYQKPVSAYAQDAFAVFIKERGARGNMPLILDSACGTAQSTHCLAQKYPDHFVVGIDQSSKRLSNSANQSLPDNAVLLRCDCTDFWRMADQEKIMFEKHYLLYPNPYPKPAHLQRRWHGHPAFLSLIAISRALELRTNWKIYAEEFNIALTLAGIESELEEYATDNPMTAFERKYQQSQHDLWRVSGIPRFAS